MSATELGLYNGTIREYLKKHDWKKMIAKSYTIIASCFHNRTAYFILENNGYKKLCFLTFFKQDGRIWYSETPDHYPTEKFMKAVEEHCPMDKWTKDWLDTCRKIKDRKKRAVMVEDGKFIEFSTPLILRRKDGSTYTETRFFVWNKKRGLFSDRNDEMCRIRCWASLDFKIA